MCLFYNLSVDASFVATTLMPLRPRLFALGIKQLLLVGSVARGENRDDSDVDFVVEFNGPATFLGYMELVELLEEAMGRSVDVTTIKSLRPEIADEVLAGALRVA